MLLYYEFGKAAREAGGALRCARRMPSRRPSQR
jgi:hypothetical protein